MSGCSGDINYFEGSEMSLGKSQLVYLLGNMQYTLSKFCNMHLKIISCKTK